MGLGMKLAKWAGGVGSWALIIGYWYFCPYAIYLSLIDASAVGAVVGHAISLVILTILGFPVTYILFKLGWLLTLGDE